jgi:hypothetical protein
MNLCLPLFRVRATPYVVMNLFICNEAYGFEYRFDSVRECELYRVKKRHTFWYEDRVKVTWMRVRMNLVTVTKNWIVQSCSFNPGAVYVCKTIGSISRTHNLVLITGDSFPGSKAAGGEADTNLHTVPRSRKVELCLHSSKCLQGILYN